MLALIAVLFLISPAQAGYIDLPYSLADAMSTSGSDGQCWGMSGTTQQWITVSGGGGSGTVTSASVVSANGFAGSVANASTTPAITLSTTITGLLKGNGTAISAASSGTDYVVPAGNVATATALAANPTDCSANNYATAIDAGGNLTCGTVSDSGLATSYVKADGSRGLSADWNAGAHNITATTFTGALAGNATTATNVAGNQTANTIYSGPSSGSAATATFRTQVIADSPADSLMAFGNGQDGALTCTGAVTLSRDMYYTTAIFGTGCVLKTAGYKIFANGTCDFANGGSGVAPAGAISNQGASAGNNGAAGGTGGAAPGAVASNTVGAGFAGIIGGAGSTTAGTQGGAGSAGANGGKSGAGGQGGAGNGNAAVAGRAGVAVASTLPITRFTTELLRGAALINGGSGGSAGTGGSGDGGVSGGGGGSGGTGAGPIFISCAVVNRSGSTTAGAIQAMGRNGGNGGTPASGSSGGGSGGGGGGGGWVYFAYGALTGTTGTNMIDVSGGAGGNGGNGTGSGQSGGYGGGSGSGGRVTLLNLSAGSATDTVFSNDNAATSTANSTGGTGTTATSSQVSL